MASGDPGNVPLLLRISLEGQGVTITLRKADTSDLPLKGRGFHWVQDYPYNPDSR
ncbi:hypothetical protein GCM10011588_72050 [Nocardia jinanensis]|uniref:Uncharacterized protein n=1 Tax=Nocardia jinanensis TaxID=382504 RepID=A0A917VYZ5_9NOCA|nr:hypothetical protein GCM10011588_72050 [Nocardia jinanensis]